MVIALALAGSLVACGGQTDEANAAIDRANAQIEKYNQRDGEISDLMQELLALGDSPEDAKKGVDVSAQVIEKIGEQKEAMKAAQAEYVKIGTLEVSDEIKTYAQMQLGIAEKQLESDTVAESIAADSKELFPLVQSNRKDRVRSIAKLNESIDKNLDRLNALQQETQTLQQEADKYFQENLGG
ncbi:MAG: hypothetical protein HY876_03340 [Coriobacteriales bacterium]|nr:hypothetical protein [Coriobacteriales bacterium]